MQNFPSDVFYACNRLEKYFHYERGLIKLCVDTRAEVMFLKLGWRRATSRLGKAQVCVTTRSNKKKWKDRTREKKTVLEIYPSSAKLKHGWNTHLSDQCSVWELFWWMTAQVDAAHSRRQSGNAQRNHVKVKNLAKITVFFTFLVYEV